MNATTEQLIRNFATESKDRRMFFQQLLVWLANETSSCGGIVWNFRNGQRQSIAQFQSPDHPQVVLGLSPENHQQIQQQAIAANQGIIVRPKNDLPDAADKKHPVILMAGTRLISDQPSDHYLIEIFLPTGLAEEAYRNASKRLDEACREVAEIDFPKRISESVAVKQSLDLSSLDSFTREIHRSIDPTETANRIANETRRVLDCDRVSVVQVQRGRPKIAAISGQASVNQRSNIVYAMRQLAKKVIPTQQPLWYPGEEALPPQIEKPLAAYLGIASTRSMLLQPFFDRPDDENLPPSQKPLPRKVIGAIVIERCDQQWDRTGVENQLAMVTGHAEDAFRNAYQHRNLLFYPLWHWLGKSRVAIFARNLTKTALAATAAVALMAALLFVPADFKIAAGGVLVPKSRSNVFATVDGMVAKLNVKHGSTVAAGDELLYLKNIDLESQAAQLDGKINQLRDTIESTETLLLAGDAEVDQPLAEATLSSQRAELNSYQSQRKLIDAKLEKLSVVAPRDGQVVTWNLEQRFRLRPVSRGEKLMEIVDKQGPWQLELMVPDRKAGHLLAASSDADDPLPVEFILAANTSSTRYGTVAEIGETTLIDPELGQCVRVLVDTKLSVDDIQQIRSGVSAKIICGKSSLGYSLFHGVGEFVQKHWFALF